MAFLKKFDIKQICMVNHQEINILSNFGSRKTKKQRHDWQFSERFWILLSENFGTNLK